MSEEAKLRKILLPVDVSPDSLTALQAACDLAAAIGAEVSGLFIEDAMLVAACSLPFAREIGSLSGISRRIEAHDIHNRFRAVADKARKALTEAGQRFNVRTSFRVSGGDVIAEILSSAADADMLVLGKAGWSVGAFRKPGSTCTAVLSQSSIPVLIVEAGAAIAPPILAVHETSPAGERSLEYARELCRVFGWQIDVSSPSEVSEYIQRYKPRLVVLPASLSLRDLASRLKCPLLFVP